MEGSQQREVVLEIEQIKIIRKRAKTFLRFCKECGKTSDFITVAGAAQLFSTTSSALFEFAQSSHCHARVENGQDVILCLSDLLKAMSKRLKNGTVKLLGDSK